MSTHSPVIEFFDIPNKEDAPTKGWSPNTIKTELVLNYKKIPYKHTWLGYNDISPTLSALGTPENGTPRKHTCPAIAHEGVLPHPIMESFVIAEHLEKHFPDNPIFPTPGSLALAAAVQHIFDVSVFPACTPILLPITPNILRPACQEYFHRTRTEAFGMPLGEYAKQGDMNALLKKVEGVGTILNKEKSGPFFIGDKPSYADFIVVAFIAWTKPHGDIFNKLLDAGEDGCFKKLWEASEQWW